MPSSFDPPLISEDVTLTIKIALEETGLFQVDTFKDPDLTLTILTDYTKSIIRICIIAKPNHIS